MDGEDTTLVVMDTWEAEKLVGHCKHVRGGVLKLILDTCLLLGQTEQDLRQGPASAPLPQTCSFPKGRRTSKP